MNVSLTTELAEFVKQQVESGMYQTASEVMRDGLRLLKQREQFRQIRVEELRKEVAIGIEQADRGEVAPLDFDAIRAEGRRMLAETENGELMERSNR
jgi:antitoxin ParD1/3/4